MEITINALKEPSDTIINKILEWDNDPSLVPLIRPNKNQADLDKVKSKEEVEDSFKHNKVYLIYLNDQLVGEMEYQVDPGHLFIKEQGTAWFSITIGEEAAQGIGIGTEAMKYIEKIIKEDGYHRIELGVFAFNSRAISLYENMGYSVIGKVDGFTYWKGEMWQDIRMEKRL
jgi:RimJ/RimL family protein N-acetyltransferase